MVAPAVRALVSGQMENQSLSSLSLSTKISTPRQDRQLLTALVHQAPSYPFLLPLPHGVSPHLPPFTLKEGR